MLKLNLKKTGFKIFIFTILILVLLNKLGIGGYIRLAAGSFGIGTGLLLIFFGGLILPQDFDSK